MRNVQDLYKENIKSLLRDIRNTAVKVKISLVLNKTTKYFKQS